MISYGERVGTTLGTLPRPQLHWKTSPPELLLRFSHDPDIPLWLVPGLRSSDGTNKSVHTKGRLQTCPSTQGLTSLSSVSTLTNCFYSAGLWLSLDWDKRGTSFRSHKWLSHNHCWNILYWWYLLLLTDIYLFIILVCSSTYVYKSLNFEIDTSPLI